MNTPTPSIAREHPEYVRTRDLRKQYQDFYLGGDTFKSNASSYLVRRHKEPNDIYFERLNRVFYENYIGSIIDWYTATLFRREPVLQFLGGNEFGKAFFDAFVGNCDRRGTTLTEFYRRQMTQALVQGKSYIAIDFPKATEKPASRWHEDAAGFSRAYLVDYSAEEVINWSYDQSGLLEWIVIRTSGLRQESVAAADWKQQTRWLYYDRDKYELYESTSHSSHGAGSPVLVSSGPHALTAQRRVPVFELAVNEGLWLMNKASLLQMEHFNKSNALGWALTMGLFATPVVYSDREWTQIVGESYFIQLGPQDKFGWTEPEGHVYQIAADNLTQLKGEIYRICYLMSQGTDRSDSRTAQSGVARAYDLSVTQDILRVYGDIVKDSMRSVMNAISDARQDGLTADVSGLDEYDIQEFGNELRDAESLLALGIPSMTLKRQMFKRLAMKYFADSRQEVKSRIADEIDQAFDGQEIQGGK